MDPNANLAEQQALMERSSVLGKSEVAKNKPRLAELRTALSDWLAAGGFEPNWKEYPRPSWFFGH
jgi:hypothetical protein